MAGFRSGILEAQFPQWVGLRHPQHIAAGPHAAGHEPSVVVEYGLFDCAESRQSSQDAQRCANTARTPDGSTNQFPLSL